MQLCPHTHCLRETLSIIHDPTCCLVCMWLIVCRNSKHKCYYYTNAYLSLSFSGPMESPCGRYSVLARVPILKWTMPRYWVTLRPDIAWSNPAYAILTCKNFFLLASLFSISNLFKLFLSISSLSGLALFNHAGTWSLRIDHRLATWFAPSASL